MNKRYELMKSNLGFYFYDSKVEIDLNLEMVLNRLNVYENRVIHEQDKNNFMTKEIYELKDDIIELRNRLRVYEKL